MDALQIRLQNQMAISDALIASMEQKYSYLSNMFDAQQRRTRLIGNHMEPILQESIRQAVSCGDYDRARSLWNEYAAGISAELILGTLSESRLSEMGELLAWARLTVSAARAHMLDQLNTVHVAGEYEVAAPPSEPRLVESSF